MAPTIASKTYDGTAAAGTVTVGTITGFVGTETVTASGVAANYSSGNVGSYSTAVNYTLADGSNGGLASNYSLAAGTATGAITQKDLQLGGLTVAASKVYDGTTAAALLTSATLGTTTTRGAGTSANGLAYTGDDVQIDATGVGTYNFKDVSTATTVTFSGVTLKGAEAGNYNPVQQAAVGATITAKNLTVPGATVTAKAYDGNTAATVAAALQTAIAGGSGSSGDGKPYTGDNLALGNTGTFERSLPGTQIPVTASLALTGTDAGNYNLAQPTGLKGEITGTANVILDGAALNFNSGSYLHVRDTKVERMQGGMEFKTTAGEILIESSSFDGWMRRSNPLVTADTKTIPDGGAATYQFSETAGVAVNSPVVRVKLEGDSAMMLGDYRMLVSRDANGIPGDGIGEKGVTVFSYPGNQNDPNALGSVAPSADLVVRDSAARSFADLPTYLNNATGTDLTSPAYQDYLRRFASLDGTTREAVWSGDYAPAVGEFKPDGSAKMSDLDVSTAAGTWEVTVEDPTLGANQGKVTDVRLKYNDNTKVLIEGKDGVRLLNVKFEGMDEVDVRTADLNNRVLMSATLVTDPEIGEMVVKAGSKLQAVMKSDVTFAQVKSSGDADLLAGVVRDNSQPSGFRLDANRTLTIDGPGASSLTPNINIAGQLAIASHTVVFNNANIVSGGVIDVRTGNGLVNRTYGSVVPGTANFTGGLGNHFNNARDNVSMTIRNSTDITSAFNGGQMRENGAGGATVMNVGKVQ